MKLTDTQSTVLAAAAARANGAIMPLPPHLRGGAIAKVCDALIAKGLAVAVDGSEMEGPVISDAGRQVLGLSIEPSSKAGHASTAAPNERPPTPRTNTKQAQLIAMLKAPEGASVGEVVVAFGWLIRCAEQSPGRSRRSSACRSDPRRSKAAGASTASRNDQAAMNGVGSRLTPSLF